MNHRSLPPNSAIPVTSAYAKADAAAIEKLRSLYGVPRSNFTPLKMKTR